VAQWGRNYYARAGGPESIFESACVLMRIYANGAALAGLTADGSVITWGNLLCGGDSSDVKAKLTIGAKDIYSTFGAFAAILKNGSVVAWGDYRLGAKSATYRKVENTSSDVQHIVSTEFAFAALNGNGSVVTWGDDVYGTTNVEFERVKHELEGGVVNIYPYGSSFFAAKQTGYVIKWGIGKYALQGERLLVETLAGGVKDIYFNLTGFVAFKINGSIVLGGKHWKCGRIPPLLENGPAVCDVCSTDSAFAATRTDGSVVTWGDDPAGGNSEKVKDSIASGVCQVYATQKAFAAVKEDGSVCTWGHPEYGGNCGYVKEDLTSDVVYIIAGGSAFAAVKGNGNTITWGQMNCGGDCREVLDRMSDIGVRVR
jgi:hypothetical protein